MEKDQMSEPSQFIIGKSNGGDSLSVTTEEDDEAEFSGDSFPGDLVEEEEEEWSGENPYCFYFVKQFSYDDPQIQTKIDEADNEIYHCNSERIHIANRLKSKRAKRLSLVTSMENLISSLDDEHNAINEAKEEEEVVTGEIYSLSERLSEIKKEIELLNVQMACVLDQRDKAFENIKILRIQRDKGNTAFFKSRVVMKKAIELAASGNVRDLEELSSSEVDKFMSRWNNDKAFRDDYKKRILPSLNEGKLRRDERIRDSKGDIDNEIGQKAIEFKKEETDDAMVYEKLVKEEEMIDEDTLKERKREEQLEKARLAMERKRKLHEKAVAKAAIRVKKEAEKKLKELEKRAKKKKKKKVAFNSSSSDVDRTIETITKATKPEKETLSVFPKQRSFKYRHHRKGNEDVPKAIIKRRKAYKLWVWTVSSASLVLPLALLIVFFYLQ